jgi:hypothetical protein
MIRRFFHNIIYVPIKVIKEALVALGMILGLYQGTTFFFPGITEKIIGWSPFVVIIFVSIIYGRCITWKIAKVDFKIPHTNTTIEVLFDDLFKQDGLKAIAVSEFFDSEIGNPVSETSLHGIFIKECLGGHSKTFDDVIGPQLVNIESNEVVKKIDGKKSCYPIGTTAIIEANNSKYIMFALSKVNPSTCKAYCDVATMWKALNGLWKKGRTISGGNPINVPLIGSGQSGVGLPTRDLLNLIILSAITETNRERITGKIRVVLRDNVFEEIDLRDIKQYWKE